MDWNKEKPGFFMYLRRETGIEVQQYYEKWQHERGCFWKLSSDDVIDSICKTLSIERSALRQKSQKRYISDARKIISHHLESKMTLVLIGSEIGIDHSSVSAAKSSYLTLYESDKVFREKADKVIIDLYNLAA